MSGHPDKKRVLIVGGGTAGWMTAAGLASLLGDHLDITLIESEAIGIVGVGEATLPHIRHFNRTIGIDEMDLMAATSATVKLGIEFCDWARLDDRYIHPFGDYGVPSDGTPFHHFWRRAIDDAGPIGHYSLPVVMSYAGKFSPPSEDPRSLLSSYRWAYQFDATAYAPYLRRLAEARGVRRIEGRITGSKRDENGDIASVTLENGESHAADLFIDCSGFRGLLIEGALATGYEDWTRWLPCDRAVAAPCEHAGELLPFTRATARGAGWQWRIPLQHRTGNGYVYSSAHTDDQDAEDQLVQSLEGRPLADPRVLRFTTGKRRKLWNRNVVAIGLSGGFLEPLESTSIYLIQQGITYLIELLTAGPAPEPVKDEYNRMMDLEFERIRDFLILHYHATEREDTAFWNDMRNLRIPHSLEEKMALFRARGRVQTYDYGLFLEASWVAVYLGQRVVPSAYDLRADEVSEEELLGRLSSMKAMMATATKRMPSHADWIASNCPAGARSAA
ncbi:tryptophan halogenase family protein [Parvularcula lutaonensis]|uniref:Tryptophan halogenase family protein n=1 Tax=Parvularcula lutaonensis TaxID=491923 RepID=A0ABV7MEZ9_9PROT|nr:tryptophan halogenase family protein [Parvularcula lutaonensis]GGY48758.1 tryptophan halogenase [Parvularcula lutaonensis]